MKREEEIWRKEKFKIQGMRVSGKSPETARNLEAEKYFQALKSLHKLNPQKDETAGMKQRRWNRLWVLLEFLHRRPVRDKPIT